MPRRIRLPSAFLLAVIVACGDGDPSGAVVDGSNDALGQDADGLLDGASGSGGDLALGDGFAPTAAFAVDAVVPQEVSARGGERLTVVGSALPANPQVLVDGVLTTVEVVSPSAIVVRLPVLHAGRASVVVGDVDTGGAAGLADAVLVRPLPLRFDDRGVTGFGGAIHALAAADVEPGGPLELVVAGDTGLHVLGWSDGGLSLLEFDPTSRWSTTGRVNDVLIRDTDGDGRVEAFVCAAGESTFLFHDAAGNWLRVADPLAGGCQLGAFADIDANGIAEPVMIRAGEAGLVLTIAMDVVPLAPAGIRVPAFLAEDVVVEGLDLADVRALGAADFDRDGDDDLVVALGGRAVEGTTVPGGVVILHNDQTTNPRQFRVTPMLAVDVAAVALGDFDRDGDTDIAAAGAMQDRLWRNDGEDGFEDATDGAMPVDRALGSSVALADFDLDRAPDLLIANHGNADRLLLNRGDGRFSDRTPDLGVRIADTAHILAIDLDGDGDEDVVTAEAEGLRVRLHVGGEADAVPGSDAGHDPDGGDASDAGSPDATDLADDVDDATPDGSEGPGDADPEVGP